MSVLYVKRINASQQKLYYVPTSYTTAFVSKSLWIFGHVGVSTRRNMKKQTDCTRHAITSARRLSESKINCFFFFFTSVFYHRPECSKNRLLLCISTRTKTNNVLSRGRKSKNISSLDVSIRSYPVINVVIAPVINYYNVTLSRDSTMMIKCLKSLDLLELCGGHNVVFITGTTVQRSVVNIYNTIVCPVIMAMHINIDKLQNSLIRWRNE